jgi:hypothetical protein
MREELCAANRSDEALLGRGMQRYEARQLVQGRIEQVLTGWESHDSADGDHPLVGRGGRATADYGTCQLGHTFVTRTSKPACHSAAVRLVVGKKYCFRSSDVSLRPARRRARSTRRSTSRSQSRTVSSAPLPVRIQRLSGVNTAALTVDSCHLNTIDEDAGAFAVSSQTRAVPSSLPVTAQRLLGLIATAKIADIWPSNATDEEAPRTH